MLPRPRRGSRAALHLAEPLLRRGPLAAGAERRRQGHEAFRLRGHHDHLVLIGLGLRFGAVRRLAFEDEIEGGRVAGPYGESVEGDPMPAVEADRYETVREGRQGEANRPRIEIEPACSG